MNRTLRRTKLAAWAKSMGIAQRTLTNIRREVASYYDPTARGPLPGDPPLDSDDDTIDRLHSDLEQAIGAVGRVLALLDELDRELARQRGAA